MIESLEERARSARQSIDEMTGPVTDREFDPPRRHVGTATAIVFAVALAAGGVWAIARGDGPQAADVAADGPDAVSASDDEPTIPEESAETETPVGIPGPIEAGAYLVFETPPAGFEAIVLTEPLIDRQDVPTFDVYGDPGDTPFADRDLVVASITVAPGESLVDPDTPTIEVDGQTIYLEDDEEGFNVVSWFRGEEGTGLLSRTFTQDELVVMMTELVRTGELDTRGLTLLAEDGLPSYSLFDGEDTVIYQPADGLVSNGESIGAIAIDSTPTAADGGVLIEWFQLSDSGQATPPTHPERTVEHNGWTIRTAPSVSGGLALRFEVDGVPIQVTMIGDQGEEPALEDALVLLGDIRGATPAEIEEMITRGGDTATLGSTTD